MGLGGEGCQGWGGSEGLMGGTKGVRGVPALWFWIPGVLPFTSALTLSLSFVAIRNDMHTEPVPWCERRMKIH